MFSQAENALTDTHCHLYFDAFESDLPQVIERAHKAGIARMLNPGIDLPTSLESIELAQQFSQVFAAVGIHPNDASGASPDGLSELKGLAQRDKVVAIGEIGLDYYREYTPHQQQQELFKAQLNVAAELGLPVIIHNRQADADLMEILTEWCQRLAASGNSLAMGPGVLHSFSSDERVAGQALELNFFIGITGPVTFRNAPGLRQVVAALPLEKILIETDSPFLTPHPYRGQRNEPAYVSYVAEKIASIKNLPLEDVVSATWTNAKRLFQW